MSRILKTNGKFDLFLIYKGRAKNIHCKNSSSPLSLEATSEATAQLTLHPQFVPTYSANSSRNKAQIFSLSAGHRY